MAIMRKDEKSFCIAVEFDLIFCKVPKGYPKLIQEHIMY